VDAYWCPEPGKKWTRVPHFEHPVLLPASRQGLRSTPGKLSPCGTPRRASRMRCANGSAPRPLLRNRCPQGITGGVRSSSGGPAGAGRRADVRHADRRDPSVTRLAGCVAVYTRRDGIDGRVLATGLHLLEGSFAVVLANAHHIKAVPGRKTDVKDCE